MKQDCQILQLGLSFSSSQALVYLFNAGLFGRMAWLKFKKRTNICFIPEERVSAITQAIEDGTTKLTMTDDYKYALTSINTMDKPNFYRFGKFVQNTITFWVGARFIG